MSTRAVFGDEADARSVAARLRSDGFDAQVDKELFAGEDDDEDHAWAVSTDAPTFVVEVLVEEHDGWLDAGRPIDKTAPAPWELPDGPRRTKGHWSS